MHMPNFKALMLNVSRSSYEKVQKALEEQPESQPEEERVSCDYMENMAVAVVTAVCAVESFANERLDDNARHTRATERVKLSTAPWPSSPWLKGPFCRADWK